MRRCISFLLVIVSTVSIVQAQSIPLEIPTRKATLSTSQKDRLASFHESTRLVSGTSLNTLIQRHERSSDVETSIALLEEVERVYTEYCDSNCRNLLYRKEAYRLLYMRTGLPNIAVIEASDPEFFTPEQVQDMLSRFRMSHREGILWTKL